MTDRTITYQPPARDVDILNCSLQAEALFDLINQLQDAISGNEDRAGVVAYAAYQAAEILDRDLKALAG